MGNVQNYLEELNFYVKGHLYHTTVVMSNFS